MWIISASRFPIGTRRGCAPPSKPRARKSPAAATAACTCLTPTATTSNSPISPKKTHSGANGQGEITMEGFAAQKLNEFETGKISRRKLIESLTLAATTLYATDCAKAQADTTLKARLVNHISYTCPNFRQAADWYSMVFNLDQVGAAKRDVALPFGKKGEQPYGVTATDVPLTHLIPRTPDPNAAPPAGGARPKPASQAVID